MLSEEVIEGLKLHAKQSTFSDNADEDDIVYDWCGGNVDDAFELGRTEGETMIARFILQNLNISWK